MEYSVKPRGGIMLLVRNSLLPFVKIYPHKQNIVLFFKISSTILKVKEDLICGCIYIPPRSSFYNDDENFSILEREINDLKNLAVSNLILFGDFNAKTNIENDFILLDKYGEFYNLEEAIPDDVNKSQQRHP